MQEIFATPPLLTFSSSFQSPGWKSALSLSLEMVFGLPNRAHPLFKTFPKFFLSFTWATQLVKPLARERK
jgi:hypothetical protein